MFIHVVLFEIGPKEQARYKKDCRIWAGYARKAKGFIRYLTVRRLDYENQYASVYEWQAKRFHDGFMKKYHDWLVGKSKAQVKVLGYYNLNVAQVKDALSKIKIGEKELREGKTRIIKSLSELRS